MLTEKYRCTQKQEVTQFQREGAPTYNFTRVELTPAENRCLPAFAFNRLQGLESFEVGKEYLLTFLPAQQEPQPVASGPKTLSEAEQKQLDEWFTYHKPTGDQPARYSAVREAAKLLACSIMLNCPESADRSAALRKVREAVMTANASIALH